jgi:hypothetical protein
MSELLHCENRIAGARLKHDDSRIRTLLGAAIFALVLTSVPATSLAYESPVTSTPQYAITNSNPPRSLLNVFAQQAACLFSALDGLYSDQSYRPTATRPARCLATATR